MKLIHYIILAAVVVLASCGDFNENLDGFDKATYKPCLLYTSDAADDQINV